MLTNSSEYKNLDRDNNVWIALIDGHTDEGEKRIQHTFYMVKFEMPKNNFLSQKKVSNCQQDAIWFYLNQLDHFSTMSNERMINASDMPNAIVDLIPYKKLPFRDEIATVENYKKLELYGY